MSWGVSCGRIHTGRRGPVETHRDIHAQSLRRVYRIVEIKVEVKDKGLRARMLSENDSLAGGIVRSRDGHPISSHIYGDVSLGDKSL